ncbi:MAG: DNA-binding domain-containing protein [Sphingobacteriales bacterium]
METNSFSLTQLQNWIQDILVQQAPIPNELVEVNQLVNSSERLSAIRHLDIYRHSYIARLRACMQNQFSALAYALGNELFQSFADQYLDANPSGSYTLNTIGEKFTAFLKQTRPDANEEQKETWPDFMIELAGFEYALSEIFDEPATENNTIPAADTPNELLKLAPVFHLFHHQFPICTYYLDFSQAKAPELPFPEESFCAVTRRDYKLGLFTIRGAQYYFLLNMQQGKSVAEAKDELIKTFNFDRVELDRVWIEWRRNFTASGFLCV